MKKIVFLLFTINCIAQAPNIEWQKSFGGSSADNARDIIQTSDGGYIVVGNTSSNNGNITQSFGNGDILILKINSLGILEWQKSIGGFNVEFINSIKQTNDDGYVLSGYSNSTNNDFSNNHGNYDFLIIKLNNIGEVVWLKNYGGTSSDNALDAIQTDDGGYIVVGTTNSNNGNVTGNHGNSDYWLVKLSSEGNIQWQKTYGGSGNDVGEKINQTNDGGYIINGFSDSTDGDIFLNYGATDIWVLKIDYLGIIEWQKSIGSLSNDFGYGVVQANDLGYLVSATIVNNGVLITKLNGDGNIEWQNTFSGNGNNSNYSIENDSDGGSIFIGSTDSTNNNFSNNHGQYDIWITKIDPNGNYIWQKTLGGSNNDFAFSVAKTNDNGYIVAGDSSSNNGNVSQNFGLSDFWVVKLFPETLSTTAFKQENINIFPNPSINQINIRLPNENAIKKIVITDLFGKEILNETENTTQIVVENLSSGMYIIKAFSEDKIYQSKFIKQ